MEHVAAVNDIAFKRSFLVYKRNKYITVPTENIFLFYVRYESTMIVSFDRREYPVNYSLEQIRHFLPREQFFRLNRQCLINFNAIKEVERYFTRRLLVVPVMGFTHQLLVSREKAGSFLSWLENR
ncbi:LytTR family DNA-binding domain-containing protein [uncultured Chitinophaga sp.]|jgi:Response regulator of the LytR/AlgR family|uniref:LytR/AlgR family response regulator transcription factor n=1 Tax=uncultured Chitinophaga sp. TaxID=339340 RepID=UPI002625E502|nr:LytTR family DNA-binding domain-containing protein [uncultured Chitinophaga sp.]